MDRRFLSCVAVVAGACSVGELDLNGKQCPCASGYVCDPVRQLCVLPSPDSGEPTDGTAGDAGQDGGTLVDAPVGGDAEQADGGCSDGGCTATLLASGVHPTSIAVDSSHVYWTDQKLGVAMCPLSGCAPSPTELAPSPSPKFTARVALGASVYFTVDTSPGEVLACAFGGCNLMPTTVASGQPFPGSLVADTTSLYWTTSNAVVGCTASSCSPQQLATNLTNPLGLALDSARFYVTTMNDEVLSCPRSGCGNQPTVLASGTRPTYAITSDGTNVYWMDVTTNHVLSCAVGGCGGKPTVITTSPGVSEGIAVDAQNVYWSGGGQISKCPLGGCAQPVVLATNASAAQMLAVDATSVYWQDPLNVWKVAK